MSPLEISSLKVYYYTPGGIVKAVDGIDLEIQENESVGIAGESGCGKSTLALSILRLLNPPARIVDGKVLFDGKSLLEMSVEELNTIRWKEISIIFQSAMNAWNPAYTIGKQIVEAVRHHLNYSEKEAKERAIECLKSVGLSLSVFNLFPHELSGGMLQRAFIGMAISCNPRFLIADEPTTALDVVNQAYILTLMKRLNRNSKITLMVISHDLSILAQLCSKIAIMYGGRIVELADVKEIFKNPLHPYTMALINAFPLLKGPRRSLKGLPGKPPSLINPPQGCYFHPRCPSSKSICHQSFPEMREITAEHYVSCHFPLIFHE